MSRQAVKKNVSHLVQVKIEEARRFMYDCFVKTGVNKKAAMQQAELLVQTDRFGHVTHGLNRLGHYIKDIQTKACDPNNNPEILKQTPSTAWVDAHNCLGATASYFGVDIAMKKAKETGIGWVTVKGSNHHGMIGFWAKLCADQGFIGLAFTNTSPYIAPPRSKKAALGTNPLAVCAPACCGEIFYLEMATSAVAFGAIELFRRNKKPLPLGWALDEDGKPTTDAEKAFKSRLLMPLGGDAAHKGYGLSAAVEIFSGISAGAAYGHHVRSWASQGEGPPKPANIGHCFGAIDPKCFAPGFSDRLMDCMKHWRKLPAVDPKLPVLVPGDLEKKAAELADKHGITYVISLYEASLEFAKKLDVPPMKAVKMK